MHRSSLDNPWRRLATAAWGVPDDPQIYGELQIDARPTIELVSAARAAGIHVTPTHVVGWALGQALAAMPDLNVQLARRRFVQRDDISVFFIATGASPHELTGTLVREIDQLDVEGVARRLVDQMDNVRAGRDVTLERTKRLVNRAPAWLLPHAIRLTSWLANDLGLDAPRAGIPRRPFGSAMVTSVGGLGLEHGYAPLAHYYRVPVLIFVGRIGERPVVEDGAIVARPILPITATIDHRYVDGFMLARSLSAFRDALASPVMRST